MTAESVRAGLPASSAVFPAIPGFVLTARLGQGGMGVVFRAREGVTGRDVAIKIHTGVSAQSLARFEREARAAAALHHPNIVEVFGSGAIEGGSYIIMELVHGQPLSRLLEARALGVDMVVRLIAKVARALHVAHANGVIHRDIKPDNIIIDAQGEPRIVDFGVARLVDDVRITRTNVLLGTVAYMSPEVAKGEAARAGPTSDVFSLGCVLYEGLAGRLPFGEAENQFAMLARISTREPDPLPETLSRGLRAACERALAKDPDARPTALELAENLELALAGDALPGPDAGATRVDERRAVPLVARRRSSVPGPPTRNLALPVFALVGLVLLGFALFARARNPEERNEPSAPSAPPVTPVVTPEPRKTSPVDPVPPRVPSLPASPSPVGPSAQPRPGPEAPPGPKSSDVPTAPPPTPPASRPSRYAPPEDDADDLSPDGVPRITYADLDGLWQKEHAMARAGDLRALRELHLALARPVDPEGRPDRVKWLLARIHALFARNAAFGDVELARRECDMATGLENGQAYVRLTAVCVAVARGEANRFADEVRASRTAFEVKKTTENGTALEILAALEAVAYREPGFERFKSPDWLRATKIEDADLFSAAIKNLESRGALKRR